MREGSGKSDDDEQYLSLCCGMLWSLVDRSCCLRSLGIVTRKKQKKQSCSGDGEGEGDQPAVVHVGDGGVGLGVLREANKAETTAATGVTVLDDDLGMSVIVAKMEVMVKTYGLLDLTELLAFLVEGLVIGVASRPPPSLVCHARPPRRPC